MMYNINWVRGMKEQVKIDAIYDYVKGVLDSTFHDNFRENFSIFISNLFNKNNIPKIISDVEYAQLDNEFYRGVNDISFHYDFLTLDNIHFGSGVIVNGIYTTSSINEAVYYAEENEQCVLKMKVNDARIMDAYELEFLKSCMSLESFPIAEELERYTKKGKFKLTEKDIEKLVFLHKYIKSIEDEKIKKIFKSNMLAVENLAMYLDVDVVSFNDEISSIHYVVINREKVFVSKSEFNRINSLYVKKNKR